MVARNLLGYGLVWKLICQSGKTRRFRHGHDDDRSVTHDRLDAYEFMYKDEVRGWKA